MPSTSYRHKLLAVLCLALITPGCPNPDTPDMESATSGLPETSGSTGDTAPGSDGAPSTSDTDADNDTDVTGSTSTSASATGDTEGFCGDGKVDAAEECDLGELNNDEYECTTECKLPSCGDGHVQPGEECDNGDENADTDVCTSQCVNAACGDGFLQPGEECDNGADNMKELGACDPDTCHMVTAMCGNGVLEGDEECDDGPDPDPTSGCTDSCVFRRNLVFVTEQTFAPNFATITAANTRCQQAAQSADLANPNKFVAWISAPNDPIANRLPEFAGYFVNTNNDIVAKGSAGLTSGSLQSAIRYTENGEDATLFGSPLAWTGTGPTGEHLDPSCNGWSSVSPIVYSTVGSLDKMDAGWTAIDKTFACTFSLHLYCVETSTLP